VLTLEAQLELTLRCCPALMSLGLCCPELGELLPFRFFPKSRPNTDRKDDFFLCGFPALEPEGTLIWEFRNALGWLVRRIPVS
jgi:hypothetical protein